MSEPMTAEGARERARRYDSERYLRDESLIATLRAYADMIEREAEIEAAYRERLAKLAEDDRLEADLGMDSTMREVRMPIAKWIRSQGETK